MVSQTSAEDWKIESLTTNQNGDNELEVERVRREHPGEPDCVLDQRVLGAIAPFRCKYSFNASHFALSTSSLLTCRYRGCSFQTTTRVYPTNPIQFIPRFP